MTCTATLIDTEGTGWAQWGLTAAHCVTNPPSGTRTSDAPTDGQELHGPPLVVPVQDKNFQLRTGALDRTQVPALEIAAFVIPPWWQWIPDTAEPIETAPGADLALLRLAAPVRVPAATLASTEPRPGSTLTVVGWGRTSNGSAATPTTASQLTTAALPPERCAAAVITRHDVCTGNPGDQEKQFGACNGDSGGPLYGRSGDRWVLTALVSRASTPTCGISPDANTGIAYYRPWIEAVVHGTVRTDLPLTPAQGGPIPHPRIGITTTDPVELPDRVAQSTS
ncbi:serine protease [Saccharothrix coeruleofusca]|uniref:Serine protease n=2 Tax=Saccharothrix coeruleofusca TaxID=33919 RepID=A0A918EGL1_9PSEU|nr:serine protease [Saccharothrix coeruleofusca]